mgnify:CR=1 FL=1
MIKKRGRPRGKKNSPKFTLLPLSIIKMLAEQEELIPVSLEWLTEKGGAIKNPTFEPSNQEESGLKVEYKITEFNNE